MKSFSTAIATLILASNLALAATHIKSVPPHGKVQFDAVGKPSMLKIKGEGEGAVAELIVKDKKLNGTIKFDLSVLKTGIDLRDEHMKEKYLQINQGENKTAILTFKDFPVPLSWSAENPVVGSWTFAATLTLHGVTQPVTGTYTIGSKKMDTTAKFDIKLSDYKVDIPQYLGVKVADVVNVNVTFAEMNLTEVPDGKAELAAPAKTAPVKKASDNKKKK